jgi:hypothetical protein
MATSPSCHTTGCVRRAAHTCLGCAQRYCGEHFLQAFFGDGVGGSVELDTCRVCLGHAILLQRNQGRNLSYWHIVG